MFSFHMKRTTDVTWLKHNGLRSPSFCTFINYLSVVNKRHETILDTNQRSLPIRFRFHWHQFHIDIWCQLLENIPKNKNPKQFRRRLQTTTHHQNPLNFKWIFPLVFKTFEQLKFSTPTTPPPIEKQDKKRLTGCRTSATALWYLPSRGVTKVFHHWRKQQFAKQVTGLDSISTMPYMVKQKQADTSRVKTYWVTRTNL